MSKNKRNYMIIKNMHTLEKEGGEREGFQRKPKPRSFWVEASICLFLPWWIWTVMHFPTQRTEADTPLVTTIVSFPFTNTRRSRLSATDPAELSWKVMVKSPSTTWRDEFLIAEVMAKSWLIYMGEHLSGDHKVWIHQAKIEKEREGEKMGVVREEDNI